MFYLQAEIQYHCLRERVQSIELPASGLETACTHFKCPQTGVALPVENPNVWVYQEEDYA